MSAPRRWTDEEIGFVQENWDRPLRWVAEELNRTPGTVNQLKVKLKRGWSPHKTDDWTADEDDLIRETGHLTAAEVAGLLLGRSRKAVEHRRSTLGVDVSKKSLPTWIGSRPLVAKTCRHCGLLLDSTWFRLDARSKTDRRVTWTGTCRKCAALACMERIKRKQYPSQEGSAHARLNSMTRDHAVNHGNEWTESDVEVLSRPDLSRVEKALILGRTYSAVQTQCHHRGLTSKLGDPTEAQWFIHAPHAEDLLWEAS